MTAFRQTCGRDDATATIFTDFIYERKQLAVHLLQPQHFFSKQGVSIWARSIACGFSVLGRYYGEFYHLSI